METAVTERCERCDKPRALCVCDRIVPLRSKRAVVILQHPQEMDKDLGTAKIVEQMLEGAKVVPGLSWGSLDQAIGREVDPKRWAVLYPASLKRDLTAQEEAAPIVLMNREGEGLDPKRARLDGILVIDGTWSQAKTLWWRNPWLLKLNRIVLHPTEPSAYGRLREQPRRNALSTLESIAETLDGLGEDPEIRAQFKRVFRTLCQRARDAYKAQEAVAAAAPSHAPKKKPGSAAKGRRAGGRAPSKSRGGGPMD